MKKISKLFPCTWPQKNVENSLKSLKFSVIQYARRAHARISMQQLACIAGMHTVELSDKKLKQKFMHRARAARPRGFDSLPSLDPD
jgi:hypothetical protein